MLAKITAAFPQPLRVLGKSFIHRNILAPRRWCCTETLSLEGLYSKRAGRLKRTDVPVSKDEPGTFSGSSNKIPS